ncbi:rhomboid family intramembrane serine protease [Chromobacterium paludis]|uniref:rhomboid family intramembrane serine protease n=1 Tax=Chromobacterium paludis TaxID=2605945 RepID=UPI00143D8BA1|nr:rhomboid family intramembrane serine protease [Chromobacterium paludis]
MRPLPASLLPALLPLLTPWGEAARRWRFDPAWSGEWWRGFTASWVHADWRHAALNSLGLLLLAGLGGRRAAAPLCLLALALPWLLAAQQMLPPEPRPFLGASGVLYGWWAAVAWLRRRDAMGRWLLAALVLRLLWQGLWPNAGAAGEAVLWSAHVGGAVLAPLLLAGLSYARCGAPWASPRSSVHS